MKESIKKWLNGKTQRWLCSQIPMTDVDFSNSMNGYRKFKRWEFDRVVELLEVPESEYIPVMNEYEFKKEKESNNQQKQ